MMDFEQSKNRLKRLNAALDWGALPALADEVLALGLAIQAIPAPTFHESARADYMRAAFARLGLVDIAIDARFNVYGRLPATTATTAPALMVVAHLDTVFPQETDLTVRDEGELIYGPGLGDNSLGTAGLLGAVIACQRFDLPRRYDVWFVATSREEGLGDLGGMRLAFETLRDQVGAVINLEGMAFGHIYHEGIAVRRLHIITTGEGGHSWAHYGRPSAVHHLLRIGAAIAGLVPPEKPRTTYNVGVIEGGQSVNTIAASAAMWLDLRSESSPHLEAFEGQVREQIAACAGDGVTVTVNVVGDRPAGGIPSSHPLVTMAMTALELTGTRGTLATGSTDGNIPLAADCPTVTLGITRGGNAHRLDEYIERTPIQDGMKQLILLALALVSDPQAV